MIQDKGAVRAARAEVIDLLGGLPGRVRLDAVMQQQDVADAGDLPLRRLLFSASHGEAIPALYLPPARPDSPAVLYCHAHGGRYDIGMAELTDGRPALHRPWLAQLAAMGAAVLCLEMPCFGARAADESALSKAHLWRGTTLYGQMIAELMAGIGWLAAQDGVDGARIGVAGISMGGTQAWWLAALDPRVRAAASLCAMADMEGLIAAGLHDGHGPYMTVPGLLRLGRTGQLAGLAAPRPLFIGVGLRDDFTPREPFATARADLEDAYAGAPEALVFHVEPDTGHVETPAMHRAALAFLARHLAAR